ncbi:hypothetical protein O4J56_02395 [Nocardiopsis sp. RSe5-2]|uniref:Integral membrane protein n=1 Tax=Nocardiopsis endophytica TaxID=3018445 RepID=A0ABT4TXR3_9ACTN|nr:hypothetical protein [Nocardiopsis endophytica]MDA2809477.1 hypothetical protein [Nocardiopsis endophytica]
MAPPAPPLPHTLRATLALLLGEYRRRPALLLGLASVPLLLGWLAATLTRARLLSGARWIDGGLVHLPTGEEAFRQGLASVVGFIGLPVAYGLLALVIVGRLLGRPTPIRTALVRLLRRPGLLLGWWLLTAIGFGMVAFGIEAPMILLGLAPPVDYAGPVRLLIVTASLFVLPAVLAQWAVLLPVALLEDLRGREAVERSWALGEGERVRHIACLALSAGLLFLPRAAAEAAYIFTDGPTKAVFWVAAEGLVLALIAPAALLTACAPVLYSLHGDPRAAGRHTSTATGRHPKRAVLLAAALATVVALPLLGTRMYTEELAHVPRLAIDPASDTNTLAPDDLEPVPGGTGFASLTQDRWRDGTDALLLYTCEADCPDGQAREREIGTLPEGTFLNSWAIAADGDRLLIGAVRTDSGRGPDTDTAASDTDAPSTDPDAGSVLAVYRCSDDDCDGPWTTDLPTPSSTPLPLYGMRLAPSPDGGYAALLYGPSEPTVHHSDETPAALLACPAFDCETPSVSRLPDVVAADLAFAPDSSLAIAHLTPGGNALHLLVCREAECDTGDPRELDGPWTADHSRWLPRPAPSVAVDPSGRPHVAAVGRDGDRLLYHACSDAHCSSWESAFLLHKDEAPGVLGEAGLRLTEDARPSVLTSGALIHCLAPRCDLGK